MELLDQIRELFATSDKNCAYLIEGIESQYPAYVFRDAGCFGVTVPYDGSKVYEEFANVMLYNEYRQIGNRAGEWLFLASAVEETRNTFASICVDFVTPGNNGMQRVELLKKPSAWWAKWKLTIGNRSSNKQPHSIIGELLMYEYLLKKDIKCVWTGSLHKSHDLLTDDCDYEIKSTTKRYGRVVSVSGQLQLVFESKDLYVVFLRFEEDIQGYCINDMVEKLKNLGVSEDSLNYDLELLGYRNGSSIRNKKFRVLESELYLVDDQFPKIVPASFIDGITPPGIIHIGYDIDLSNVQGTAIDLH